ncbi:MAG TPA: hypothetical protein VIY08_06365 [Candidatus Nitrosocosmicus sp.]
MLIGISTKRSQRTKNIRPTKHCESIIFLKNNKNKSCFHWKWIRKYKSWNYLRKRKIKEYIIDETAIIVSSELILTLDNYRTNK